MWNVKAYPSTRFSSEYGIMSLPSLETLLSAALPNDLTFDSEFTNHRQHHIAGYVQILIEISINLPPIISDDFDTFIYLSQVSNVLFYEVTYKKTFALCLMSHSCVLWFHK